jgi:hypothetical protein
MKNELNQTQNAKTYDYHKPDNDLAKLAPNGPIFFL